MASTHSIVNLENGPAFYAHILQTSKWYSWMLIANAVISVALFPLVLFLILRKSPQEMSSCICKMVLNSNVTALVIAALMAIWLPVPLHPILGGFSMGAFRWFGGPIINRILFSTWLILLMNLSVNYLFAFLHYYALLAPTSLALSRFNRVSMQFCTIYLGFLGVICCIVVAMDITAIDSPEQLQIYANSFPPNHFIPVMVATEASTIGECVSAGELLPSIIFALLCGTLIFQVVAILTLNVGILLAIRKTRNIVEANTFSLQVTAYLRLFLAKSLLLLIFFFLPFLIISLSFLGIFSSILPQLFSYLFFAFHSPLLMLQTIILIRPYRDWTFKTVSRIKTRLSSAKTRLTLGTRVGPITNVEIMNKTKNGN